MSGISGIYLFFNCFFGSTGCCRTAKCTVFSHAVTSFPNNGGYPRVFFAIFVRVTPGRCPTEKVPEIFIPLPVAEVVVYFRVAGLAEAHKVVSCMSAAFGNGQDVVNFLHRSQPTFLEAHLTEGMLCRIAVTDAFPCSTVLAVDIGAALVFVVLAAFLHTVLLTKLSFTKVGTAEMRAGSEWSLGHSFTSFGYEKSPTGFDSHEAVLDSFSLL